MQETRYISFFNKKSFAFLLPNAPVSCIIPFAPAGVMELVDVVDSKASTSNSTVCYIVLDFQGFPGFV